MKACKKQLSVLLILAMVCINMAVNAQANQRDIDGKWELVSAEMKVFKSETPSTLYKQYTANADDIRQNGLDWSQVLLSLSFEGSNTNGIFLGEYANSRSIDRTYRLDDPFLQLFLSEEGDHSDCVDCPNQQVPVETYLYKLEGNMLTFQFEYTTNDGSASILCKLACTYRKK